MSTLIRDYFFGYIEYRQTVYLLYAPTQSKIFKRLNHLVNENESSTVQHLSLETYIFQR